MSERRTRRLKEARLIGRLNRREKTASFKWWSDPPKLIPILISIIAVAISCLSWWESHRGRLINEEINRPVLSIAKMDQEIDTIHTPSSDGIGYSLRVDIKNTGKSTAKIFEAEVESRLSNPTDTCYMFYPDENIVEGFFSTGDVLPGIEKPLFGHILLSSACEKLQILRFEMSITVNYLDVVTGKEYYQLYARTVDVSPAKLKKKLDERINGPNPTN